MFLLLSNNHSLSEIFETSEVFCWSPFFVNPDPSPKVILAVSLLKHRSTETQFSQKLSFFYTEMHWSLLPLPLNHSQNLFTNLWLINP